MFTEVEKTNEVPSYFENPRLTLKTNGKSFYFASMLFNKQTFEGVCELYSVCRFIDDVADEAICGDPETVLEDMKAFCSSSGASHNTVPLIFKQKTLKTDKKRLSYLLDGALFDTKGGSIDNDSELYKYCYQVAGVVGEMMCPLIKVQDGSAHKYAIALGIAMQLTNISRDVREDFESNRIYLHELKALNLMSPECEKEANKLICLRLLEAEKFYAYSKLGLSYIPLRSRIAILFASELYRAIGQKIISGRVSPYKTRAYLNVREKILVSFCALRFVFSIGFWFKPNKTSRPDFKKVESVLEDVAQYEPDLDGGQFL
jgi:phytoene synthase